MIIDFRKDPPPLEPLLIDNIPVEQVSIFKFLGSLVNNDLTWEDNCDQKLKTARQNLFFENFKFIQCETIHLTEFLHLYH